VTNPLPKARTLFRLKLAILREAGCQVTPQSRILDFGCGSGVGVQAMREAGYEAYGTDIEPKDVEGVDTSQMVDQGWICWNREAGDALPFADDSFDYVFSDQVFEHIHDYDAALSELARVMCPTGASLHVFPSRGRPLEAHVFVPFSAVIRTRWWMTMWVRLGIRRQRHQGLPVSEVVDRNLRFLGRRTNYLPGTVIKREFQRHFEDVQFVEHWFLKHSGRGRHLYSASRLLPFLPHLFRSFQTRVVLSARPR